MKDSENSAPIFREVQRFSQIWLWVVVAGLAAILWRLAFKHHLLRPPFGGHSKNDLVILCLWLCLGVVLPLFLLWCRMITEVRRDGVYVRFIPFHRTFQRIPFADFNRYEMRVYNPMAEFGGWGIRHGREGRAYNIAGNHGIEFTFIDRSKLLVGSQRVREFLQAIHSQCKKPRAK
jgi:hypothetical protein